MKKKEFTNEYLYRLIIFLTGKTEFKELYFYQLNLYIVEQFNMPI